MRNGRPTDTLEKAKKRLELFHDSTSVSWFSGIPIIYVNAQVEKDDVIDFISKSTDQIVLRKINYLNNTKSFYPVPKQKEFHNKRSTRFHFHIDAEDNNNLFNIFQKIQEKYLYAQHQIKIYPISNLHLGNQINNPSCAETYKSMMNFHPITKSENEAFITGRMGYSMDYNFMNSVLESIRESRENKESLVPERKFMTEVEEYLGEWQLKPNGEIITESNYMIQIQDFDISKFEDYQKFLLCNTQQQNFDISRFKDYKKYLVPNIPPHELHLGFDLPNSDLSLDFLVKECAKYNMDIGGWFIFGKGSYRSNEFSYETDISKALELLLERAKSLQKILKDSGYDSIVISYSLELVHAIWQF
jgi:hypothetical protein